MLAATTLVTVSAAVAAAAPPAEPHTPASIKIVGLAPNKLDDVIREDQRFRRDLSLRSDLPHVESLVRSFDFSKSTTRFGLVATADEEAELAIRHESMRYAEPARRLPCLWSNEPDHRLTHPGDRLDFTTSGRAHIRHYVAIAVVQFIYTPTPLLSQLGSMLPLGLGGTVTSTTPLMRGD